MLFRLLVVLLSLAAATSSLAADAAAKPGQVLFALNMSSPQIASLPLPPGGSWVNEGPDGTLCLKVTVPPERAKEMNTLVIPIDLRPYRGMQISLECLARADQVTDPGVSHLGVKSMLHYAAPSGEIYMNQKRVHGTFEWKKLSCGIPIGEDVTKGEIHLGLQGSSGTAWFKDVRILAIRNKPVRPPLPSESAVLPPAYRGHDLPRLRGVMSPPVFREQDFIDLEAWNVNVIRWQIVRNWGKTGQERDLVEYDKWMDGKIDELDKVLESAQRHGIKVMIDLHSPPGGREADATLTMILDKKYQDHFVKTWQKIATRFKGHPALWAYDLINEPVQNTPSPAGVADHMGVQVLAARAIREIDPKTAICIEVEGWDSPEWFTWITPVDVPNVIYQVHMYWHGGFTGQGVNNVWGVIPGDKLVRYPGQLGNIMLDKDALRRYLQPVRDFQRTYNAHIFVGEFSAVRWAPGADQYLSDLIDIFEDYGWDWTYHAFREWPGWSVEHADLPADTKNHPRATEETARAKVLKKWFAKNQRATP